jgi:WhiB family redox-sensing transcriptional regulator
MYPPEQWWEFAECALVDDQTRACFFAEDDYDDDSNEIRFMIAQAVCSSCLAVEDCLTYALASGQKYGVWGMHTPKERRNLKRQMSRRPENALRYWNDSFTKVNVKIQSALDMQAAEKPRVAAV